MKKHFEVITVHQALSSKYWSIHSSNNIQETLALASMVRDDLPASSTAAAMRGKVGSEFET